MDSLSKALKALEEDDYEIEEIPMPEKTFKRPRGSYTTTGTYSLSKRQLKHGREEVSTATFRALPKKSEPTDTRIKSLVDNDVEIAPTLDEDSSPGCVFAVAGLSEVSIIEEEEDPTRIHSVDLIDRIMAADRESFKSRKTLEAITTSMTPTLKAIMDLPTEAFVNYLQSRPSLWVQDDSVPSVRAWVWCHSPRYRVVERLGRIENKTEAFDNISVAEDRPLGRIYMEMIESLED